MPLPQGLGAGSGDRGHLGSNSEAPYTKRVIVGDIPTAPKLSFHFPVKFYLRGYLRRLNEGKKMYVECLAQSRAGSKQPRNDDVIIILVVAVVYPDGCSWTRASPVLSLLCPRGLHWPDTQ